VIKISGACTLSKEPYPYPDTGSAASIFDAWGFRALPVGTDWTRAFAVVNYRAGRQAIPGDEAPEATPSGPC